MYVNEVSFNQSCDGLGRWTYIVRSETKFTKE